MSLPNKFVETGLTYTEGELLAPYTYMQVGGEAEYLTVVRTREQLILATRAAITAGIPVTILGGASNVVISDKGISGLVIINRTNRVERAKDQPQIWVVDSGVMMNRLVNMTVDQGMGGLEVFLGIPGTIGGAVINNAHYLDRLLGEVVQEVEVLTVDGIDNIYLGKDCRFAYDYSIFQETKEYLIRVTLVLEPNQSGLREIADRALSRRRDSQPLSLPSSGCMFKNLLTNEAVKLPPRLRLGAAGQLIDAAGLKGKTVGGAMVSTKHANFIVNTGTAKAEDIRKLVDEVTSEVKRRYGVVLEKEVFFIGEY